MTSVPTNNLTTDDLHHLVASLEADTNKTGDALIAAEHKHKLTVRRALLSGDHDSAELTRQGVEAARIAHQTASNRVLEARDLLREAIERDKALALEIAQREAGAIAHEITELADAADQALATFVRKVSQMRRLELLGRQVIEQRMNTRLDTGAVIGATYSDAENFLSAFRGNETITLKPFAKDRAAIATKRILAGAGIAG
ncbi:hypothetical protein [Falsiroseomonas tokyonensis]|uniref:Uncharacterized protein n=1 Tax=Falsiroseomonas tokyonensis TaxID=430521 RepID=A0ABV7BTA4_9PROT|nr:hypothetical protein [Falsiroseomonas tokyonensis]MBU8538743.1 hypothetical protein [Falsiroseomonas tokyonensis]